MSWDFIWGLLIGGCVGFLVAALTAASDDRDYAVETSERENKEVEE